MNGKMTGMKKKTMQYRMVTRSQPKSFTEHYVDMGGRLIMHLL